MSEQDLNVAREAGAARALDQRGEQRPAPGSDGRFPRIAAERRIAELQRELARMRGREATWRAERSRLLAALAEAERELVELPALRYEAEVTRDTAYWLAVVQSSWSWRLTRPLRTVSRLVARVLRGRRDS
jgi:hypothetical protein